MDNVNTVFWTFNFWRHHESVGSGRKFDRLGRVRENGPADISDAMTGDTFTLQQD